ncbi:MAG TPA: hypothetical protein PKX87_04465, partial [Alphaproteobacteria bacterium]|nr:hypothetical protein [Alphaproteobacteria bacterium]
FEEDHENLFIVAESQKEAVAKAKTSSTRFGHLHKGTQLHKDTVFDVDSVIDLSAVGRGRGLHLHLRADAAARPGPYTASYVPISIRSDGEKT